jgi:hypothetical protein
VLHLFQEEKQGALTNPDGLVLDGCAFYVIQNNPAALAVIKLSPLSEVLSLLLSDIVAIITRVIVAGPVHPHRRDDHQDFVRHCHGRCWRTERALATTTSRVCTKT